MSKSSLFFFAFIFALISCQEETYRAEEITTVEISLAEAGETIDWNHEIALIKSAAVLQKAALALDVDPDSVKVLKFEADITDQKIRVIGAHGEAIARAYKSLRLDAALSELEDHLRNETGELGSINLEGDPDQMTYEKALQALEEEPADDGVLYRKTPKE